MTVPAAAWNAAVKNPAPGMKAAGEYPKPGDYDETGLGWFA
jgi:hypothetical protein